MQDLQETLFGSVIYAKAALVVDGTSVKGMAIYCTNYSTWRGRPGIWLEDLFVRPQYRGQGLGRSLFHFLAAEVLKIKGTRLEWCVLKWNKPSIGFYESLGASNLGLTWQTMRLEGAKLDALAQMFDQ